MTQTLPPALVDNPRLDQWVAFPAPGRAVIATGKVEIGQGVLTAMRQIAADALGLSLDRIDVRSGDTALTPNEGYTSGSLSIQFGGVALRLACVEVRLLFLEHVAARDGRALDELAMHDGAVTWRGTPTGDDYWSLAAAIDLARPATGRAAPSTRTVVGTSAPRLDLPPKLFGAPVFLHDMVRDGMRHARVIRRPGRQAVLQAIDEAALRRAARGPIEIVRDGNFVAVVGADETVVETVAANAARHVRWDGVESFSLQQGEAQWLLQRPSIDTTHGSPEPALAAGRRRYEATFTRAHLSHGSIAPSCGLAEFDGKRLQVWTHSQGVYPLRDAIARMLELDVAAITVTHVQGPGCYGHNGADDAAADAALIAHRLPGRPIRVRWRREEEFGFEPVSPAMVVTVRAQLDAAGRPADWTTEIWSAQHASRPGRTGGHLLAELALPDPPPPRPPADVPEANGGGATRNAEPLYDVPAKRIVHHLIREVPVRTSSLRGLGAMANVFAIEAAIDELAQQAGMDPVAYRVSIQSDARARAVIERAARLAGWQPGVPAGTGQGRGIGFARYKNRAAYAAVVVELAVDQEIRLLRAWCAADGGLIVNPDGAINQLEGGVIQAASWVLKEQVALGETGITSLDWESYPVIRFSEVPEIAVELVDPAADRPALGIGEATAGPTAGAIGNAVAHALGARLRDLPLTRERIMAALLKA